MAMRQRDRDYCEGLKGMLEKDIAWVAHEPNGEGLWRRVRESITRFLTAEWRNGLIDGITEERAFYVRCGRETMTHDDVERGRLIVDVGVALGDPPEFQLFQICLGTRRGRGS